MKKKRRKNEERKNEKKKKKKKKRKNCGQSISRIEQHWRTRTWDFLSFFFLNSRILKCLGARTEGQQAIILFQC